MTNQPNETVYNFEMMKLIYGDYEDAKYNIDKGDPQGIYKSARTFKVGPLKLLNMNYSSDMNEDDVFFLYSNQDSLRKNEFLLNLRYGKSDTLSTLMLLYPSLDFKNKFHMDHIYPKSKFKRSYLKKQGISEDKIDEYINSVNDITNLQLLAAQLNEEKLYTDFDQWFNYHQPTEDGKFNYRAVNYLPNMEYTYENYPEFIEKRRELLKNKLCQILVQRNYLRI